MKFIPVIIVIFAVLFYTSCQHKKHHEKEDATFICTPVVRKDTTTIKEYVCQIRSIQHIDIRTLEKGYLQNIFVDEGKTVKKDQLLFQIMPFIYQAETQKAKAEATFAEVEYQNMLNLANKNIVSQNELALAHAKYEKAKAELELAQTHLKFTQIRAPFDGIIGRFQVRLGSLLDESELLTTLSDNSKMWVYFNVPESEYLDLFLQKKANQLDSVKLLMANNQVYPYSGFIETIEADFNNETGNIAFRATFLNPDRILRHGETGNILMPIKLKKALIIPQKATFEVLEKKYVFVVKENGVIEQREVQILTELPHLFVIKKGLNEGEKILIEGLRKVKHGQHVKTKIISFGELMKEIHNIHAE